MVLLQEQGFLGGLSAAQQLVLGIIALGILIVLFFVVRKKLLAKGLSDPVSRRREIIAGLDLLEKQYLKREIEQKTFEKLFREKQEELIKVESAIQGKIKKNVPEDHELLDKIEPKKRHFAVELLQEKKNILSEMQIARTAFLKRKIDSKTYEQLTEKTQSKLVEVQAKIHAMLAEENAKGIMQDLKKKLRQIDTEEEKKKQAREKEIVDEIIEQLEHANYLK